MLRACARTMHGRQTSIEGAYVYVKTYIYIIWPSCALPFMSDDARPCSKFKRWCAQLHVYLQKERITKFKSTLKRVNMDALDSYFDSCGTYYKKRTNTSCCAGKSLLNSKPDILDSYFDSLSSKESQTSRSALKTKDPEETLPTQSKAATPDASSKIGNSRVFTWRRKQKNKSLSERCPYGSYKGRDD